MNKETTAVSSLTTIYIDAHIPTWVHLLIQLYCSYTHGGECRRWFCCMFFFWIYIFFWYSTITECLRRRENSWGAEEKIVVVLTSLCSGDHSTQKAAWFNPSLTELPAWDQANWLEGWKEVNINEDTEAMSLIGNLSSVRKLGTDRQGDSQRLG